MKAKLGSGSRFAAMQNSAAAAYEKKGMSPEHAKEVGAAIAAKAGQKKYGVKKMTKMAVMAKKKVNTKQLDDGSYAMDGWSY